MELSEVNILGKRGPKPGEGGAPIRFNDEYHATQRELMAESRRRRKTANVYLTLMAEVLAANLRKVDS